MFLRYSWNNRARRIIISEACVTALVSGPLPFSAPRLARRVIIAPEKKGKKIATRNGEHLGVLSL